MIETIVLLFLFFIIVIPLAYIAVQLLFYFFALVLFRATGDIK